MSRKLDAAIARALGYEVEMERFGFPCMFKDGEAPGRLPMFSENAEAMLILVEEMLRRSWEVEINNFGCNVSNINYYATFVKVNGEWSVYDGDSGRTMLEAVAKAAVYALTGKRWMESSLE